MSISSAKGVQQSERAVLSARRSLPDWDAARIFLEVVRRGSFRAAAKELGWSINSLRTRIQELEHALQTPLLIRHNSGVHMTPEGEIVFAAAKRMEDDSFGLLRARENAELGLSGEVRIATTEGLGAFWIAPRLVEFQRANPKLLVHLDCAMQSADLHRLEADVSVQLNRPTAPGLIAAKIGRLHLIPFAAESYLQTFGRPRSKEDLVNHKILIQADNVTQLKIVYDSVFPGRDPIGLVALRTNVSSAYYWMLAKGGGIGVLPTYAQAIGADVVPVDDLGIYSSVDIWLSYHPDMKRVPRVARMIEWIIDAFSPKKYPWFRDEFVHPNDFEHTYRGDLLVNMFGSFASHRVRETTKRNELMRARSGG